MPDTGFDFSLYVLIFISENISSFVLNFGVCTVLSDVSLDYIFVIFLRLRTKKCVQLELHVPYDMDFEGKFKSTNYNLHNFLLIQIPPNIPCAETYKTYIYTRFSCQINIP